jgi:hypothetical protein
MTTALTLTTINDEPRVLDTDLAIQLGMARPTNIRSVIEANREELEGFGGLHVEKANPGPQGGRPTEAFYLNEKQALLLCMFSRAATAKAVRAKAIRVFTAWRKGDLVSTAPALPNFSNPAEAARAWAEQYEAKQLLEQKNDAIRMVLSEKRHDRAL